MSKGKKLAIGIAVVVVTLGIIGAISPEKDESMNKQNTAQSVPSKSVIDTYADKLGATNKIEAYYTIIGAKDGAKYTLNGKIVEIYDFDIDKLADGLKQLYNDDSVEIRRTDNTIFVFHDYPEDSAEVDTIMQKVRE